MDKGVLQITKPFVVRLTSHHNNGLKFVLFSVSLNYINVKKLLLFLLSGSASVTLIAQNLNLVFNPSNNNRNYQVVIDGTGYNSTRNLNTYGTPVGMTIMLTNFDLGSHSIAVYRLTENNGNFSTSGNALYSRNFVLRNGYDMVISISGTGSLAFSEKYSTVTIQPTPDKVPMINSEFQQLLTEIRTNRYQSARVSVIKEAFGSSTDYFTANQVRQMILLINAESSRLELAKLSYDKVTDPSNFSQVYGVLNSQASRNDLIEYVRLKSTNDPVVTNGSRDPMTVAAFDQLFEAVNYIDQPAAGISIREAFTHQGYFFTSAQVKKLLMMIGTEADRLELAKLGYLKISDPGNFSTIYPLLYTTASRQEMSTYIRRNGGTPGNFNIQFTSPMPDAQFNELVAKAKKHFFPWDINKDIKDAFSDANNHFTTYQVRQLLALVGTSSILTSETDKLDLAKLSYRTLTDPANFMQLLDMFTSSANKEALENYVGAQLL